MDKGSSIVIYLNYGDALCELFKDLTKIRNLTKGQGPKL